METARSSVTYRVLGPVEAVRDGELLALGGPRQRALLSLLLLEAGRVVSRDRLIHELWAGEPPEGAETTLRSYVSRLRATLAGPTRITVGAGGYVLDVGLDEVDSQTAERLVQDAESALASRRPARAQALATEAAALWRGPAYGDLATDGLLRADAERLEELRLRAAELRLEASLDLGAGAALVDELETAVRAHPYREALWRHLMLALYRADRQADALAAYQRAREHLADELGLDPGEGLERLQQQILRHEVPAPNPLVARTNVPGSLSTFIGRTGELAEIAELLERQRLVSLVGIGGVGKTRLALETARARIPEHPDGVFFVDLAPLADSELLAGYVSEAIGVREQPGVSGVDRLVAHLRDADALLVLDNCEHLRDACADLATSVLRACPTLRLLATTREVLGVAGEAEFPVPPLGLPNSPEAIGDARASEAVRLFLERAREARPGIPDDDETIETVARICADLDGLPLGIELAAARARALSPAEIGDRIRDRFRFLVSWRRLATARHRTLLEAMDWSYGLLEPDEQHVLRGLSVFVGGFTLAAVAAVSTEGDEDRALQRLERLVEASLVAVDATHEVTRYGVLETVRQYGAGRLESSGATAELRDRHARYFASFVGAARDPLRDAGVQADWIARLDQERDNIRAALTWSLERGEGERALRMAEALWYYFWVRGEPGEGRTWLERSLEGATTVDPELRATALLGLGGLAWALGDLDVAEPAAAEAARLLDELGNAHEAGKANNTLGLLAEGRGDPARARDLYVAALDQYRTLDADRRDVQRSIAVVVDNLGTVELDLEGYEAAGRRYQEARDINVLLGDPEGVAMNDLHLAMVDIEARRWPDARRRIASALDLYHRFEFLHYAAECLEAAATVAVGVDEPREAAFALGAANQLRGRVGNPPVPVLARIREREEAAARLALSDREFEAFEAEGRAASFDAAVDRVLRFLGPPPPS